jgi:hypothetical protein
MTPIQNRILGFSIIIITLILSFLLVIVEINRGKGGSVIVLAQGPVPTGESYSKIQLYK